MGGFDWDHLRSFLAVARCGRLTRAASKMQTDHTTLGRRISCLEESLKTKLFERSPAGYALTADGARLLAIAEQMETLSIDAFNEVGGAIATVEGVVRIAAPDGLASYFLAPRLTTLIKRNRGLRVQIMAGNNDVSLSKREADIVIALRAPSAGRVVARRLIDYDLRLYGSESYLSDLSPIRDVADLGKQHFVGYIGDLVQMPGLNYLSEISRGGNVCLESSNLLVQLKAAICGSGLCVLPAFIASTEPSLRAVLPDEVQLKRSYWMVVHEDHRDTARVKIVADFIADEMKNAGREFSFACTSGDPATADRIKVASSR